VKLLKRGPLRAGSKAGYFATATGHLSKKSALSRLKARKGP
jgi:hypothetical protein